jgi:hypothetical protein
LYFGEVKKMGMILEKGLQQVKQFYIEQLVKSGNYRPEDKELSLMTITELKNIYQNESVFKH